jgi:hypothetical protein
MSSPCGKEFETETGKATCGTIRWDKPEPYTALCHDCTAPLPAVQVAPKSDGN